jgi:hypothetical protein
MARLLLALSVLAAIAGAQVPLYRPAGLVLSAGATIERAGQPVAKVQVGELVFPGDTLRAGQAELSVLSCSENARLRLAPATEVRASDGEWAVASGKIVAREAVTSCYLPSSPKLSLASQQHYGVLAARSGSIPPPEGTFEQRVSSVPEPKRSELKTALQRLDSSLREDPRDAGAHISRAAVLEQSGLLYDAGESYRTAAVMMPGAPWLRRKVIEIENRLLAGQPRR